MPLKQIIYTVAKKSINALPRWLLRLRPFEIYEIKLEGEPQDSLARLRQPLQLSEVELSWAKSTDELSQLTGLAAKVNLHNWNGKSHRALIAWRTVHSAKKPVGVVWINRQSFTEPDLGLCFQLESKETWLHSAHVFPDFQRQGIYQAMLRFLITDLKSEGDRRILFGIAKGNEASKMAHKVAGPIELGSIFSLRSIGISFCKSTRSVKPNGIAIGKLINLKID